MVQYGPSVHDDSGNSRIEPPDARLNYRLKIQGGSFEPNRPREWNRDMLITLGTYGSGIHWPKTMSHKVDVNEYPYMHLTGIYTHGRVPLELPSRHVFFPDSILNLFYF